MGEVTLAGGVVLDIASGKELSDGVERLRDELHRTGKGKPLYHTAWAASVAGGTGVDVLKFGRPASGRIWNLVFLTVFGNDDHTVVAGATVASYVGDPDNITLHGLIDPANGSAVPNSSNFSEDQIWVHDNEELFVVIYGAAANQRLGGVARVLNYNADDRESPRI